MKGIEIVDDTVVEVVYKIHCIVNESAVKKDGGKYWHAYGRWWENDKYRSIHRSIDRFIDKHKKRNEYKNLGTAKKIAEQLLKNKYIRKVEIEKVNKAVRK